MQGRNAPGKIFPPLIIIEYGEVSHQDIIQNTELVVEYKVIFNVNEKEFKGALEVFIFIHYMKQRIKTNVQIKNLICCLGIFKLHLNLKNNIDLLNF